MKYCFIIFFLFIVCLNSIAQSHESDVYFTSGMENYHNGDYDKAIEDFNKCWNLDSLEISPNNVRRKISRLWLGKSYMSKGDSCRGRFYCNQSQMLEAYDRRKSNIGDSLLSRALYRTDLTTEEKLSCIMDSEKPYAELFGNDGVNMGVLFYWEAYLHEINKDYRNAILCGQKSWEILSKTYGRNNFVLPELKRYYEKVPTVTNEKIDQYLYPNWYVFRNSIKTFENGEINDKYGILYRSSKDTILVLPAIYDHINNLSFKNSYATNFVRLDKGCDTQLIDISGKCRIYGKRKNFQHIDGVICIYKNNPIFSGRNNNGSLVIGLDGKEFLITDSCEVDPYIKDSIMVVYKEKRHLLSFNEISKINKASTLFNIRNKKADNIVIVKEIVPDYYQISYDDCDKYGIAKIKDSLYTEILPIEYDYINRLNEYDFIYKNDYNKFYAVNNDCRTFSLIDLSKERISCNINLPNEFESKDIYSECQYLELLCSDDNDMLVKWNRNLYSIKFGFIAKFPSGIQTKMQDTFEKFTYAPSVRQAKFINSNKIIVSDDAVEKEFSLKGFVNFIKSYSDENYCEFNYDVNKNYQVDGFCPVGYVSLKCDYPFNYSFVDAKIRQKLSNHLYSIGNSTKLEYLASYQKDPRILFSLAEKKYSKIAKYYEISKLHKYDGEDMNYGSEHFFYSPIAEDENYITYFEQTLDMGSGSASGYENLAYETYRKEDGKLLTYDDIVNEKHIIEFNKILARKVINTYTEENYNEERTYEGLLDDLCTRNVDSTVYVGPKDYMDSVPTLTETIGAEAIYKYFPKGTSVGLSSKGVIIGYDCFSFWGHADGNIIVELPYEEIEKYLKIAPMKKNINYSQLKKNKNTKLSDEAYKTYLRISDFIKNGDRCSLQQTAKELEGELVAGDSTMLDLSVFSNDNLVDMYCDVRQKDSVLIYAKKNLDRLKQWFGCDSYLYINALIKYTKIFAALCLNDEALKCYKEMIPLLISQQDTLSYGIYMDEKINGTLSDIYRQECELLMNMGRYDEALEACLRSLQTISSDLWTEEWDNGYTDEYKTPRLLLGSNLSECYYHNDNLTNAARYAMREKSHIESYIMENIRTSNTPLMNRLIHWYGTFLPHLATTCNDDSIRIAAYNALLTMKNISLNSEVGLKQLIENCKDTTVQNVFNRYEEIKKLIKLYSEQKQTVELQEKIEQNRILCNSLENDLILRSKAFGDYQKALKINMNDVISHIHNDEVAIEFTNYDTHDNTFYTAFILKYGDSIPHVIPLFDKNTYESVSTKDKLKERKLTDLIWSPILKEIGNVHKIIFSPSGLLYSLGIEYLPLGDKCINEVYDIFRVSSTREIALSRMNNDSKKNTNKKVVLYGGINYDLDETSMHKDYERYKIDKKDFAYRSAFDSTEIDRNHFDSLPGAQKEVNMISEILRSDSLQYRVTKYDGNTATESSIKSLSSKNVNILHISTHGFYMSKRMASKMDYNFLAAYNNNASYSDADLLRSGLLFAGANNTFLGKSSKMTDMDDGILTSQEIVSLDFRGMDLAVLSACQTGQGELSDDGVSGLQRGFKKAGVKSLLMSLWDVNDNATQILMSRFYQNMASGKTKHESFHEAQSYLRKYNNGQYDYPKYWQAFIMLDALE